MDAVRYEVERGIGLLTLNRPEQRNAWTVRTAIELDEVLTDVNRDDDVRVVVVTGAGSVFSVGADLQSGSIARPGAEHAEPPDTPMLPSQVLKPVIAALNGHAVGAGISFAMHCDVRLLAQTARIGFAFVRRGVIAEMAMHWLLPRVVGMAVAADLLLTGRIIGADEAWRLGLVHRVLASEDVVPAALELAGDIADNVAPMSAACTKQLLWQATEQPLDPAWSRGARAVRSMRRAPRLDRRGQLVPREAPGGLDWPARRRSPMKRRHRQEGAMPQIGAVVTIVAQEGQEEELIAVLGAMQEQVSAEPGCDLYRVVRLNRQPRTFVLLELYRDAEALAAHQSNAALARFGPALEPLTESMDVRLGTVLDLGADPASPWQNMRPDGDVAGTAPSS